MTPREPLSTRSTPRHPTTPELAIWQHVTYSTETTNATEHIMSKTVHRNARRERDGFTVHREPRRSPRRQSTTRDVIRAELARDVPAVRAALRAS